jgi:O-antigen ligase
VLLAAAVLISLPYVQTLESFQRFSTIGIEIAKGDFNQRTLLWREGLASFVGHPLIGVGSNNYRSVTSLNKVAHNSFLSVLVEVGLIGFTLFGIILTIAVIKALSQPKWDKSFWLTVLVVWAICAFSLTYEHTKATWLFLSLLIASAALPRYRDEAAALGRRNEPKAIDC